MKVWMLLGESPDGIMVGPFIFSSEPSKDYINMLFDFLKIENDTDFDLDLVDVIDPNVSGILIFHD